MYATAIKIQSKVGIQLDQVNIYIKYSTKMLNSHTERQGTNFSSWFVNILQRIVTIGTDLMTSKNSLGSLE
jgi:hypothetical protein